jgi:hypothetical protein
LRGVVENPAEKARIEALAKQIPGVKKGKDHAHSSPMRQQRLVRHHSTGLSLLWFLLVPGAGQAQAPVPTVTMDDPAVPYSPFNWGVTAQAAKTINSGAYFKVVFSGSSCQLMTDTSANSGEMNATPHPPPQLTARWDPATIQLSLSWPAWATNYTLYGTTNLTPPVQWQPMTNSALSSSNGLMLVALPTTNAQQQFFLLKAPQFSTRCASGIDTRES